MLGFPNNIVLTCNCIFQSVTISVSDQTVRLYTSVISVTCGLALHPFPPGTCLHPTSNAEAELQIPRRPDIAPGNPAFLSGPSYL